MTVDLATALSRARRARKALRRSADATHRLSDFSISEISLVDKPANATPLLVRKREGSDGGLRASIGRALIAKRAMDRQLGRERAVQIVKASSPGPNGELQYALGLVLAPETPDAQHDVYAADEVRKAAWDFLAKRGDLGLMHKGVIDPSKAEIVESYVTAAPMTIGGVPVKEGSWLLGVRVLDPDLWAAVKSGQLDGLSIGGVATRRRIAGAS